MEDNSSKLRGRATENIDNSIIGIMNASQNGPAFIKDNKRAMQEYFNRVYVRKNAIHSIRIPSHLCLFKAKARPPTGKDLIAFDNEDNKAQSLDRTATRYRDIKSFQLTFDGLTAQDLKRAEEPFQKKPLLIADEI